jgi:hypothetical protein
VLLTVVSVYCEWIHGISAVMHTHLFDLFVVVTGTTGTLLENSYHSQRFHAGRGSVLAASSISHFRLIRVGTFEVDMYRNETCKCSVVVGRLFTSYSIIPKTLFCMNDITECLHHAQDPSFSLTVIGARAFSLVRL